MSKEWKTVCLAEVCSLIKRGISPKYTTENGIPVINQRCIRNQKVSFENVRLNDPLKKKIPNDRYLKSFDVLVNSTGVGTLGRVAQIGEVSSDLTVDSHVTIVRLASADIDLKYFGFLIKQNQRLIELLGEGSTGQTELSRHRLGELELSYPHNLQEQKAIAHILGTLDNKIELNRKMNETLEAMAQAMFKSWFVDFDPVLDNALAQGNTIPDALQAKAERRKAVLASGKYKALPAAIQGVFPASFVYGEELGKWIPDGWKVSKLKALVDVKYGKDHKKLNEGKYPCYGSGGVMRFVEKALCESESVLIPRKGSLNNMLYIRQPFWSVDTMFFTLFKKQNMVKFIFYYLKKFNFAEMNVGSAVPSMTTKVLNNIDIITPCENVLRSFEEQIELLATRKESNTKYNEKLTKTRDLLLSQLISGKTRLPESFVQQF